MSVFEAATHCSTLSSPNEYVSAIMAGGNGPPASSLSLQGTAIRSGCNITPLCRPNSLC
eukprot:CAMPEP_0113577786 /NCGR_PEP_ID=MMETSP0015_2-20120614/29081_1 /TAXON_ID=2838 /ORGANISM="Odontella" /LENGTH=58 /DNA_ID=CAMNT_0000481443 /DNA_START=201 /DNA_END=380 /DNA_ORIENTATION=- /assembly_acc=CAM_ASM_000160